MSNPRVLTMPAPLATTRLRRSRGGDPRYVEAQRLIVDAIRYLVQADPEEDLAAIELLSERLRTKFRMSDNPELLQPQT